VDLVLTIKPEDIEAARLVGMNPIDSYRDIPYPSNPRLVSFHFADLDYGWVGEVKILKDSGLSFHLEYEAGESCSAGAYVSVDGEGMRVVTVEYSPEKYTPTSIWPITVESLIEEYNFENLKTAFFAGDNHPGMLTTQTTLSCSEVLERLRSWEDLTKIDCIDTISGVLAYIVDDAIPDYALHVLRQYEQFHFLRIIAMLLYT